MAWILLLFSGLFEVVGVTGINMLLKNKNAKSLMVLIFGLSGSFGLLSLAMQDLPMGTAYAIWTGIGTVGSGVVGILFFGESKNWLRLVCMGMVLGAAVGLKLIS